MISFLFIQCQFDNKQDNIDKSEFTIDIKAESNINHIQSENIRKSDTIPQINAKIIANCPGWDWSTCTDANVCEDCAISLDNICPNTIKITTSSELKKQQNINYGAENLYSLPYKDQLNAWVEGVDGNGIGQRIKMQIIDLQADYEPWDLSGEFKMFNGYVKDENTWRSNGRVKCLNVYRGEKLICRVNLLDSPSPQAFRIDNIGYYGKQPIALNESIEFEIYEVYEGDKYQDVAISFFSACCAP